MELTDPRQYRVHHLVNAKTAAARAGLSTKMFLVAAEAGQLGSVELLCIGRRRFVRAAALADFLEGSAKPAEADLFGGAA